MRRTGRHENSEPDPALIHSIPLPPPASAVADVSPRNAVTQQSSDLIWSPPILRRVPILCRGTLRSVAAVFWYPLGWPVSSFDSRAAPSARLTTAFWHSAVGAFEISSQRRQVRMRASCTARVRTVMEKSGRCPHVKWEHGTV